MTDVSPPLAQPRVRYAIWVALAALVGVLRWWQPGFLIDDAYISFRHAWNFALGEGFVYNPGERVTAVTGPMWGALLSIAGVVGGRDGIVLSAHAMNLAGVIAAVIAVFEMLRLALPASRWMPIAGAVAMATQPDAAYHWGAGMETGLYIGLVMPSLLLALHDRLGAAAFLATLACGLRPDGIALLIPLLVLLAVRRPPRWWIWPAFALLCAAGTLVIHWLYYGLAVPHSLIAKKDLFSSGALENAYTLLTYACGWITRTAPSHTSTTYLGGIPMLALFGVGSLAWCRNRHGWLLPVFTAFYVALLIAGRVVIFSWYLVPIGAALVPIVALAFDCIAAWAGHIVGARLEQPARIAILLAWIGCNVYVLRPVAHDVRPSLIQRFVIPETREMTYARAAETIAPRLIPGDIVAIAEIGIVGWMLPDAYILDLGGLCSPEVRKLQISGLSAKNRITDVILERWKPRFLVDAVTFRDVSAEQHLIEHYKALRKLEPDRDPTVHVPTYIVERRE